MATDPQTQADDLPVSAEKAGDEGHGLDRVVTAIALIATVALILLSPLGS